MYSSILVPTDGSGCSGKAIEHAIKLAKQCDAKLHFLYVVHVGHVVGMAEVEGFVGYAEQIDEDITRMGKEALAAATIVAEQAGVEATQELSEGGAAAQVISEAAEAHDLVVIGGHGRSGLARVLLGSVSESVLRHVHTPVLVVHCEDAE